MNIKVTEVKVMSVHVFETNKQRTINVCIKTRELMHRARVSLNERLPNIRHNGNAVPAIVKVYQ